MLLAASMILLGFIALIWSADPFVSGVASIAKNMGVSPILIGLTIVGLGTSAPEILVSITASLSGAGDLAIDTAIGSNIANIALILGITLLVSPLMVKPQRMNSDIFWLLVATFVSGLLILDGELSQAGGWRQAVKSRKNRYQRAGPGAAQLHGWPCRVNCQFQNIGLSCGAHGKSAGRY